jgi:hypothetical protein
MAPGSGLLAILRSDEERYTRKSYNLPAAKRSSLAKIKAGDHFNRRHTQSMSRIEMLSPTPILAELGRFAL